MLGHTCVHSLIFHCKQKNGEMLSIERASRKLRFKSVTEIGLDSSQIKKEMETRQQFS